MEYFPLDEVRASQKAVLLEIDKALEAGNEFIILEAPVGSGKSAIAMTLAKAFGNAHLITPRKSLQNQYFDDFSDEVVLMKGRGSYPCTFKENPTRYKAIIRHIETGMVQAPDWDEANCATAPCRNKTGVANACLGTVGICPYNRAIEIAEASSTVVHNLHSFIYQTNFSMKFSQREILIVDEAHEIEAVMRDFITKKITLPKPIQLSDLPSDPTGIKDWCSFLSEAKCLPEVSSAEARKKRENSEYKTKLDDHMSFLDNLQLEADTYGGRYTVKHNVENNTSNCPTFEFVPHNIGNAASMNLFSYGKRVVLMSGTIYDKSLFCRNIGVNPEKAYFIRIPSTFPLANRPIYAKSDYQADTSYQGWNDNFKDIVEKISKVCNIFSDVKGLIQAPSYDIAEQLYNAIPGGRVMTHGRQDFQEKLSQFYASEGNSVFISPVCQQGVDFKDDRSRFQIVLRVPYPSTADDFIREKVESDFNWYNYQALVVFGQQMGRVNRSEGDYGATFLMDERFNKFISRNAGKLPKWLQQAIIYR